MRYFEYIIDLIYIYWYNIQEETKSIRRKTKVMKTKEKQGYSYLLSLAALLLALTCAILCGALPTVAAKNASENNFLEENYNITEDYSALPGEESNLYSSLDAGEEKEVSKSVINLITKLWRKLNRWKRTEVC